MELTQLRERSDAELTKLGSEYDLKRQGLEDLEVSHAKTVLYQSAFSLSACNSQPMLCIAATIACIRVTMLLKTFAS